MWSFSPLFLTSTAAVCNAAKPEDGIPGGSESLPVGDEEPWTGTIRRPSQFSWCWNLTLHSSAPPPSSSRMPRDALPWLLDSKFSLHYSKSPPKHTVMIQVPCFHTFSKQKEAVFLASKRHFSTKRRLQLGQKNWSNWIELNVFVVIVWYSSRSTGRQVINMVWTYSQYKTYPQYRKSLSTV